MRVALGVDLSRISNTHGRPKNCDKLNPICRGTPFRKAQFVSWKLQAEARGDAPKLKIVRPDPTGEAAIPTLNETPGLFDNDLDIGDLEIEDTRISAPPPHIASVQIADERRKH